MAFDPDSFLQSGGGTATFNPDEFIAKDFNPDKFLTAEKPKSDTSARIERAVVSGGADVAEGVQHFFSKIRPALVKISPFLSEAEKKQELDRMDRESGAGLSGLIAGKQAPASPSQVDVAREAAANIKVDPSKDDALSSKAIDFAGQMAPIVASGPAAPFTGAMQMAGSAKHDAQEKGLSEGEQDKRALVNGAVGAVLNLLPIPGANKIAKIESFVVRKAASAASSAALNTAGEATIQGLEGDYSPDRLKQAGGIGAVVGAIFGPSFAKKVEGKTPTQVKALVEEHISAMPKEEIKQFNDTLTAATKPQEATAATDTTQPTATTPAPAGTAEAVAKMGPDEFFKWAHEQPEGMTSTAHKTGVDAIGDPEAIARLKDLSEASSAEIKAIEAKIQADPAKAVDLLDKRNLEAFRNQFFNEAIGAAENTGSAATAEEVVRAHAAKAAGANVDLGPRNDTISKGDGTPTPFEKDMTEQWAKQIEAETGTPTKPQGQLYGIKQAAIEAELTRIGAPIPEKAKFDDFVGLAIKAKDMYETDRNVGTRLIDSLAKDSRPASQLEQAILGEEMNRRMVERNTADASLIEAQKTGDEHMIAQAQERADVADQKYRESLNLTHLFDSRAGAALGAIRLMHNADYTFVGIERRALAANEGNALPEKFKTAVKEVATEIENKRNRLSEIAEQRKGDVLADEMGKKRPPRRFAGLISEQAKAARERIKARLTEGRVNAGIDPLDLADHAIVGAEYLLKGVDKFVDWSKYMAAEFGDRVVPHLAAIWDESQNVKKLKYMEAAADRQMKQLERQVENREVFTPGGRKELTSEELAKKRAKIDELKNRREWIRGEIQPSEPKEAPRPMTPEEKRVAHLDRQIADVEKQLKDGAVFSPSRKPSEVTSPEIKAREAKLAELKDQRDYVRDSIQSKDIEPEDVVKLRELKKRRREQIDTLYEKIANEDLAPRPKKEALALDAEAERLQTQLDDLKEQADSISDRIKYENSSTFEKAKLQAFGFYDTTKNIMAGMELSYVLRQGGVSVFSHPMEAIKASREMFQALVGNPTEARIINKRILNDAAAKEARANGTHFTEAGGSLNKQEEFLLHHKFAAKIPVVSGLIHRFEAAGTVFLNRMRLEQWNAMSILVPAGDTIGRKSLAAFINESSGRGSLGHFEQAAVPLSRVLFSPRYLVSRFQLLLGHSLWDSSGAGRKAIATEYAKTAIGAAAFYGAVASYQAMKGGDAEVQSDPTKGFGKIRIGSSYLDPLAGLSQTITFVARTARELSYATGLAKRPLRPEPGTGGKTWSDTAKQFVRSKLHPVPGLIWTALDHKDFTGKQADVLQETEKFLYPMTYSDIYDAMKARDMDDAAALSTLTFLGMGLSTYDKNKKKPYTLKGK